MTHIRTLAIVGLILALAQSTTLKADDKASKSGCVYPLVLIAMGLSIGWLGRVILPPEKLGLKPGAAYAPKNPDRSPAKVSEMVARMERNLTSKKALITSIRHRIDNVEMSDEETETWRQVVATLERSYLQWHREYVEMFHSLRVPTEAENAGYRKHQAWIKEHLKAE